MKPLLLILVACAWLAVMPNEARGCSCGDYEVPICALYWRADAVFAGQLLDITPTPGFPSRVLHFTLEQTFRGVAGNRVQVETDHGTSCDLPFKKGKRYLVYAFRNSKTNQLSTGFCSGTTELDHASEELNVIRSIVQGEAKGSILGRLLRNRYEAIPGVKVTVRTGLTTLEATTDAKGNFSVSVPAPGKYTVRAFIPFAADFMADVQEARIEPTDTLTSFEYDVVLKKNECNYLQISAFKRDLHATAEISGNILTALGRPVNPGRIHLVKAADEKEIDSEPLDDNGAFKFKQIAVGEYYLVLNPRNEAPDEESAPYPRTYYPNATDANVATKIVVTEGVKLENLTLRVGPSWEERVVTGNVVWTDGRPAQDVHVGLYDGKRYVRMIKLDEKGGFNFKVYGDFKYAIEAKIWGENWHKSERVPITEKSTGLKLVLKPMARKSDGP